ncbi:MAG TPA: TlpA disulfide reductase family protein [Pyrinomonadaceae bacterium]|nr:TlpA disulfide reductase family protein [Pyrinomonadaceae bacterium]
MKLALTLSLIACTFAPAADAVAAGPRADGARLAAVDGVARRVRRPIRAVRRGGAQARRSATRKTYRDWLKDDGRFIVTEEGGDRVVKELDGAGLMKLLRREGATEAKPLLVNFWATWCEPCRTEFPDLVKIDTEFRSRGLEFVVVSVDDVSEIKSGVPQFLRRMRAGMPAYLLNATDTDAAVTSVDPTWGGELPATFLFDREGKVVFKHTGIVKPAELRTAIEKVLGN